jgi:large subunit ribosomal protein L23
MSKAPKSAVAVKPEHYDVIRKPVITEKATMASEAGAVVFQVAMDSDQAADQGSRRGDLWCEGEGGEHHHHQGQGQAFRGRAGERSDKKKAYVMLEDGQTIDVTTGL